MTMKLGDLVRFTPETVDITMFPEHLNMIGMITSVHRNRWGAETEADWAMVLWSDGVTTDTHLNDLSPIDRARLVRGDKIETGGGNEPPQEAQ